MNDNKENLVPGAKGTKLPQRFYETVEIEAEENGYSICLDRKALKTPSGAQLRVPTEALAKAICEEWRKQLEVINPATMPLTQLANSAMEVTGEQKTSLIADAAKYAGSDLICYLAEEPEELIMKQMAQWNPILDWAEIALGVSFNKGMGVTHIEQPPNAIPQVQRALEDFDPFSLVAIHTMTTLTGSVLLVLAHIAGRFDAITCWQAAHVDEDWQISKWGWDDEAKLRREARWKEMEAAERLFALVNNEPPPSGA